MMGILLTVMGKSKFHDGNAITIMGKIKSHDVNRITTMGTIQFLMMGIELLQWKKFKSSNGKRITVMENIKETYYLPAVGRSIIYSYGYNTKKAGNLFQLRYHNEYSSNLECSWLLF